jgi:hypothetical protein
MIGRHVPIQRELVEQRGLLNAALSHHRTDPPALNYQSESATRRPGNSDLFQHNRHCAYLRRNYGTGRVLLERAVALDPNAAWAWRRLGLRSPNW